MALLPMVTVLSPDEIKAIDKSTRELLQSVGIKFSKFALNSIIFFSKTKLF